MQPAAIHATYVPRQEFEALQKQVQELSHCKASACKRCPDESRADKIIKIVAVILVCTAAAYKDHKSFLAGSTIAIGSHLSGFKTSQKLSEAGSLRGCNGIISVIFGLHMEPKIESIFEITVLCSHILGHHHHGTIGSLLEKAYPVYIGLFAGLKIANTIRT